ncbi:unnamed protein product [Durusdinium trenchii]|uniref:Uncharacterized protein n=1 Tax=Durusdinium trenchii TaxID=1381693 RepID=A0ABP0RBY6_9DINO
MRAFPPAWPKQPEAFTVVKQADDLLLKEDLWLADARDFLRNGPQWPMADMSKAPRTELPRRLQSVNFLAWQKGQTSQWLVAGLLGTPWRVETSVIHLPPRLEMWKMSKTWNWVVFLGPV